ncbi:hypothetical protein HYU15_00545 [Candidatus Woesearchaeota archaeon]|nr:hypothetical protein [Candidatus Woesearchaeota archaeon]
MNCCGQHSTKEHVEEKSHGKTAEAEGGKAGFKEYLIIAVLAALIIFAAVAAAQISALKQGSQGGGESSSQGESYDEMMQRMHPDQYAKSNGGSGSSGNTMVGGC